jgi:hypothetical protein
MFALSNICLSFNISNVTSAFNRAPIAASAVETLDRLPPPATKSIQAIKAASDRGMANPTVLTHLKIQKSHLWSAPPARRDEANLVTVADATSVCRTQMVRGRRLISRVDPKA